MAEVATGRRQGRHKGCPYGGRFGGWRKWRRGDARAGTRPAPAGAVWGWRRWRRGDARVPTRGAPTGGGSGDGGSGDGVTRGQAQGVPLRGAREVGRVLGMRAWAHARGGPTVDRRGVCWAWLGVGLSGLEHIRNEPRGGVGGSSVAAGRQGHIAAHWVRRGV